LDLAFHLRTAFPLTAPVTTALGTLVGEIPGPPQRYRVQFTIGQETHDKLRRVQALLRREIPSGDPGEIFDRALTLLMGAPGP